MKLKCIVCFFVAFLICVLPVYALELQIHSENAILYNLDENTVLYEKNPDEVISIASLTKIMTAIVSIENIENVDEEVTLTYDDFVGLAEANAAVAGFYVGEKVTIKDLLYGLLFPSGADAAQALTRLLGGREHFVELMNEKAKFLGLENTHFVNETGLDADGHYSTVREVGTILKYALQNETFKSIFETKEYKISNGRKTFYSTVQSSLKRTGLSMDYLLGGKTGTTYNAGLCLASSAYANGSNYMLVTCRAPNDWVNPKHIYDAKTVYDYFIEHFENVTLLKKDDKILEIPTKYSTAEKVEYFLEEDIIKYVSKDVNLYDVKIEYDGTFEITPWMKKGEYLGKVNITYQDEKIKEIDIVLKKGVSFDVLSYLKDPTILGFLLLGLIVLFIFLVFIKKKRGKKCRR